MLIEKSAISANERQQVYTFDIVQSISEVRGEITSIHCPCPCGLGLSRPALRADRILVGRAASRALRTPIVDIDIGIRRC